MENNRLHKIWNTPAQTPASSSADGYTGQIVWDVDYMYVCTNGDGPGGGTDTWKRSAMSVW